MHTQCYLKRQSCESFLFIPISKLGRSFVPVDVFPRFVDNVANFIPTKKALELIRQLENEISNKSDFYYSIFELSMISFFVLFAGIMLFNTAIKISKKTGNILYY